MALNIAMDGPVGAGKSTIAEEAARRLGILHLDTGAMYRAVGLTALKRGVDLEDEAAVTGMCGKLSIDVTHDGRAQRTWVDGEDVTGELRTERVSMAASKVATYGGVRAAMVEAQRRMALRTDMLVDGRDIGTRVLPDATVKIFLTADPLERARRRHAELREKGVFISLEEVLADLKRRDDQDLHRAIDPLVAAPDAVVLDSTHLSFEQTVEAIVRLTEEKTHG